MAIKLLEQQYPQQMNQVKTIVNNNNFSELMNLMQQLSLNKNVNLNNLFKILKK